MAALHHQVSQLSRTLKSEAERLSSEAAALETERAKLKSETEKSQADLAEQREKSRAENAAELQQLDEQKRVMDEVHVAQTSRITLNVGGRSFVTSRATLRRWPGSFLEVMFSGRHALHPREDGSFFIDRDGDDFATILAYLRLGDKLAPQLDALEQAPPAPAPAPAPPAPPPPPTTRRAQHTHTQEEKDRLWVEADYFGLPGLCDLLRGCGYARALTEEDARMRAAEDKQRRVVRRARSAAAGLLATDGPRPGHVRARGGPWQRRSRRVLAPHALAWRPPEAPRSAPAPLPLTTLRQRLAFAAFEQPGPGLGPGLVEGLFELFPAAEGLVREPARGNYTMLFESYAQNLGSPSPMGVRPIVASEAQFLERFNSRHRDVLSRLREVRNTCSCGWFVAGGSVLGALQP